MFPYIFTLPPYLEFTEQCVEYSVNVYGGRCMRFIAYMDLLGVKSIAAYSPNEYYQTIEIYQNIMSECILNLPNQLLTDVYMFSDCAYLESEVLPDLIFLLRKIREELMLRGIFFNAVVTQGALNAKSKIENNVLNSIRFLSRDTVEVYNKQVSFTGVGISVDQKLINEPNIADYIVKSCYNVFTSDDKDKYKVFVEYFDVKYSTDNKITLGFIIKRFIETFCLDSRAARYYLSGIVTIMRSMSLDELNKCSGLVFSESILEHSYIQSNFSTIQIVYIDCLLNQIRENQIINLNNLSEIAKEIDSLIANSVLKKGVEDLHRYLPCILNNENKFILSKIFTEDFF